MSAIAILQEPLIVVALGIQFLHIVGSYQRQLGYSWPAGVQLRYEIGQRT